LVQDLGGNHVDRRQRAALGSAADARAGDDDRGHLGRLRRFGRLPVLLIPRTLLLLPGGCGVLRIRVLRILGGRGTGQRQCNGGRQQGGGRAAWILVHGDSPRGGVGNGPVAG